MTENTAKQPVALAELEETVRQRLIGHGQHGALAEFAKYTAAVHERLHDAEIVKDASPAAPETTSKATSKPKKPATKKASSK